MLVSMKDMLQHALRDGYAVGQFNINNLEWVGAVLSTAQQCRSPVFWACPAARLSICSG